MKRPDAKYGTGSVVLPKGRMVWRIQYWYDGRRYVESSGSTDRRVAVRLLRTRLKEMGRGRPLDTAQRRAGFDDLVELLKADYRRKENRSLTRALQCVARLRDHFAHVPVVQIDFALCDAYVNARLDKGAALATVKQERAILGRMLSLAVEANLIPYRPKLPTLGEPDNARQGFMTDAEFEAIRVHLPEPLKPFMTFGYLTGWRPIEYQSLLWKQVDFEAGVVRLEPATSKNRQGRFFPFSALPELGALLREQRERTSELERDKGCIVAHVFHRNGRPIRSYYDGWRSACERAELVGRLVYDFRRTAVRRLERAGVPRSQAMKLVGHKTESIYRRYAISNEADLREAVAKVAAQVAADKREPRKVVPIDASNTGTEPVPQADSSGAHAAEGSRK